MQSISSRSDMKTYIETHSIQSIVSFWTYQGLNTSLFHLIMEHTPLDKIIDIWNISTSRFNHIGIKRILSKVWLDSNFRSPLDCLLQRKNIYHTTNPILLRWILHLLQTTAIHNYLSDIPLLIKLQLTPTEFPTDIRYTITSYV